MTARAEFFRYCKRKAQARAFALVERFAEDPVLYRESRGFVTSTREMSFEEGYMAVLEHSCKWIAPEWDWSLIVTREKQSVAVSSQL